MPGDLKPELCISKVDSSDSEFLKLIALLDRDLQERNGEEQQQYDKYNKVNYRYGKQPVHEKGPGKLN